MERESATLTLNSCKLEIITYNVFLSSQSFSFLKNGWLFSSVLIKTKEKIDIKVNSEIRYSSQKLLW